jgi:hypothetical protein
MSEECSSCGMAADCERFSVHYGVPSGASRSWGTTTGATTRIVTETTYKILGVASSNFCTDCIKKATLVRRILVAVAAVCQFCFFGFDLQHRLPNHWWAFVPVLLVVFASWGVLFYLLPLWVIFAGYGRRAHFEEKTIKLHRKHLRRTHGRSLKFWTTESWKDLSRNNPHLDRH